jgi:hypothetical protein
MVAVAVVLGIFLTFAAIVILALAAYLRAEDARRVNRILLKRIDALEKHLGIARPPTAAPAAAPAARVAAGGPSLEERIALVWFARIGAVTLVLGAAFLFLYDPGGAAVSRPGRVGAGVLAGLGALAFAEMSRKSTRPLYNQVICGTGLAMLLASAFASHALYRLVPAGVAFAAVGAIALLGGALSMRYRGEAALVLSLAGALLAPRLLWADAPAAAMFAWVLAASGLAAWVAVRMAFRFTLWISMLGAFAWAGVWFVRSFDARPPGPEIAAGGRDHPLPARIGPLLFAAVFVAEWLWIQGRARRVEKVAPRAFLVAALILGHALFAALLHESPALLALVFAGLGLVSARVLARERLLGFLAAPLLLGFFSLGGAIGSPGVDPVAAFGGLVAWAGAVVFGYLRAPAEAALGPRGSGIFTGGAAIAFLMLAGQILAPHHPLLFGAVVVAWSAAIALLAAVRGWPVLLGSTAAVGLLGLLGAGAPIAGTGARGLALMGGLWALVYVVGVVLRVRRRGEDPGQVAVAVAAGAAVGACVVALVLTVDADRAFRAALFALAAAAQLGMGLVLRDRAPRRAAGLLALAVALFAGSAALLIPGAGATLAWALVATLLVVAGFAGRSSLVRSLGLGLFAATLVKLALWDVWTLPRAYQVPVFLAVGALLLAASYLYARRGGKLRELWKEGEAPPAEEPPAQETQAGGD